MNENTDFVRIEPYIPASQSLPEITVRGVILGIFLAILLAASSTFVGLKMARTIAGSIPAALISMMLLRRLKGSNILENNMVQTIASAGEVVAAGVIFTVPALILMGHWKSFDYLQTVVITMIGGMLGVMFSVPLRRSMIVQDNMPYPEGLATAEILKAGEDTKGSTKILLKGSLFAAIVAFLQTGFKIASEQLQYWTRLGNTAVGASIALSPVMLAAGYIVGMRGLMAFFIAGLLTWGIGIPIFVYLHPESLTKVADLASALALVQKENFRYVGIGVFAIGGIWSVISLVQQIKTALHTAYSAMKKRGRHSSLLRTDRDIPFQYVLWGIVGISIPTFILFLSLVKTANFGISGSLLTGTIVFATVFSLLVGFICAAIAAYIVGIVGTTSLPVSGITIIAIIGFSAILLLILKGSVDFSINTEAALKAAAIVIVFAAIVCVAATVSGDNMQDLKAGYIVGATPWKQQLMLIIGSFASALVIPFILQTTYEAYGIGDMLPREGMDPKQALPAPQATLMATVAKGFFFGESHWNMIFIGLCLGLVAIIVDEVLKRGKQGVRFPALLFGLGIYFPLSYVTAFFVGALISSLVKSKRGKREQGETAGILCASGIIAGEAILGALLTIPFAYYQTTEVFALNLPKLAPYYDWMGILLYLVLCLFLYKTAFAKKK